MVKGGEKTSHQKAGKFCFSIFFLRGQEGVGMIGGWVF
jgi:hypothetical protein